MTRALATSTSVLVVSIACSGAGGVGLLDPVLAQQRGDAGDGEEDDGDDQRGEPGVHGGREPGDRGGDERAEAVEGEDAGAAEHPGADAGLLALLGQLGLRELDLGAHEVRRLVGELLDQL